MAKNDAVSVLHATLDYRRVIDVPGYDKIDLDPAARFIATMNYGYAGTKELNEALVSRFMVINMPSMTEDRLMGILKSAFPDVKDGALEQFSGLFLDLQLKAKNGEISTKAVDMRGLIGALKLIKGGLNPMDAIDMRDLRRSSRVSARNLRILRRTAKSIRIKRIWRRNPRRVRMSSTALPITGTGWL